MDLHYKQEVTVGLLVIVSIAVLFSGLSFLSGKSLFGAGMVTFAGRFENISGLGVGDPIQISGVKVGRVVDIDLQDVNEVVVHIEVSGENRPHIDAKLFVRALDALGAMYIDYVPGRSEELLQDGQTISGSRDLALVETATAVAGQASDVLVGAGALLSERTAAEIHETLDAVQRAMNVVAQLGSGPAINQATLALEALANVAARLDSTLASPDLARSLARLGEITENVNEMVLGLGAATEALGRTMLKIESDTGTIGRLVNDTTLYYEMVQLTTSLRLLLDDMRERPGRYFHLRVF